MISFDVKADVREVDKMLTDLQRKHVPAATVMALNRTGKAVMTVARRETARSMGIAIKEIKEKIAFRQATQARQTASVFVTDAGFQPMNLIKWRAKQTARGVSYRMHGPKYLRAAFINPGQSGNRLVFKRTSKSRYPIIAKTGPSVALAFMRGDPQTAMDARGRERWPVEFERALKRKLQTA